MNTKTRTHTHTFVVGNSKMVAVCSCGAFRHTAKALRENPPIVDASTKPKHMTETEIDWNDCDSKEVWDEKMKFVGLPHGAITLDGEPAEIFGARLPFARVRAIGGICHELAWPTVERIVAAGGQF